MLRIRSTSQATYPCKTYSKGDLFAIFQLLYIELKLWPVLVDLLLFSSSLTSQNFAERAFAITAWEAWRSLAFGRCWPRWGRGHGVCEEESPTNFMTITAGTRRVSKARRWNGHNNKCRRRRARMLITIITRQPGIEAAASPRRRPPPDDAHYVTACLPYRHHQSTMILQCMHLWNRYEDVEPSLLYLMVVVG